MAGIAVDMAVVDKADIARWGTAVRKLDRLVVAVEVHNSGYLNYEWDLPGSGYFVLHFGAPAQPRQLVDSCFSSFEWSNCKGKSPSLSRCYNPRLFLELLFSTGRLTISRSLYAD